MNDNSKTRTEYAIQQLLTAFAILMVAAVLGSCFLIPMATGHGHFDGLLGTCSTLYVIGALVAATAWFAAHMAQWDEGRKPGGSYVRITTVDVAPDKKKHDALDPAPENTILRVEGRGSQAADPVELTPGLYRLRYELPPRAPTTVQALGLVSRETITILDAANGSGSITFDVLEPDRYVFQVEIAAKTPREWSFECERV